MTPRRLSERLAAALNMEAARQKANADLDELCRELIAYFVDRGKESGQPAANVCRALLSAAFIVGQRQPDDVRAAVAEQAYRVADNLIAPEQATYDPDA